KNAEQEATRKKDIDDGRRAELQMQKAAASRADVDRPAGGERAQNGKKRQQSGEATTRSDVPEATLAYAEARATTETRAGDLYTNKDDVLSAYVTVPKLLRRVDPAYPAAAREARAEGTVVLEVQVGSYGGVIGARVLSGPALLRNAALEAVR